MFVCDFVCNRRYLYTFFFTLKIPKGNQKLRHLKKRPILEIPSLCLLASCLTCPEIISYAKGIASE